MPKELAVSEVDKNGDGKIEKYEIENAMRTLMEAEEIKGKPELMKHVLKAAKGKQKAIKSIQDLKDARDEAIEEGQEAKALPPKTPRPKGMK